MVPPTFPTSSMPGEEEALELLFNAACYDNLRRFKVLAQLLDKGRGCLRDSVMAARIGRSAGRCTSPLAASHGSMEVCMYLVERHKVDVNDIDMEGCTPLVAAIHGKHASAVKIKRTMLGFLLCIVLLD